MTFIREDQAQITVAVTDPHTGVSKEYGPPSPESWATYAGGALTSAGSKTRPGGMGRQVALGGPATRADATITTQNSDLLVGQHGELEALVGRGEATITIVYLDRSGVARPGERHVVTGILKEVELPGQNFDSPATGMYKLVVDCDEVSASS